MKITGIIAEYNPFHNGHLYQLNTARELTSCDYIVVVMSGHFSQRGTPCIIDKFTRAQMALLAGADLVIELPVPFATGSAERFSEASISLLNQTGVISHLCFGSESGDIDKLAAIASILTNEPPKLSEAIKVFLREGLSYPTARQRAVNNYLNLGDLQTLMSKPNNILGIEYLKALLKYQSNIQAVTIKRRLAQYHDETISHPIASATAIRKLLTKDASSSLLDVMPDFCCALLKDTLNTNSYENTFSILLQHQLILSHLEELYSLWDIPKNLCHSIFNHYDQFYNVSDLIKQLTSKTYSKATVQRSLLRILLGIQDETMQALETLSWTPYIRILGCKKSSLNLISHINKHATVPVITNLGRSYASLPPLAKSLINYELYASKLYYCMRGQAQKYQEDFSKSFLIV